MSSDIGYYIRYLDLFLWTQKAQRAIVTKNKVRKSLWEDLVDIIHWNPVGLSDRATMYRLSRSDFVALQSFCLSDGRGDSVSSDALLNWTNTIHELRMSIPAEQVNGFTFSATSTQFADLHRSQVVDVESDVKEEEKQTSPPHVE